MVNVKTNKQTNEERDRLREREREELIMRRERMRQGGTWKMQAGEIVILHRRKEKVTKEARLRC